MRPWLLRALGRSRPLKGRVGVGGMYHTNLQGDEDGAGADGEGEHSDHCTHHQVRVQNFTLQGQQMGHWVPAPRGLPHPLAAPPAEQNPQLLRLTTDWRILSGSGSGGSARAVSKLRSSSSGKSLLRIRDLWWVRGRGPGVGRLLLLPQAPGSVGDRHMHRPILPPLPCTDTQTHVCACGQAHAGTHQSTVGSLLCRLKW